MLYKYLRLAVLLSVIFVASCDNSHDHDDDKDEHVEAEGFQLSIGDSVVIDHKDNSVVVTGRVDLNFTGVEADDEKEFTIQFYNHEGKLFTPGDDHGHDDHGHGDEEEASFAIKFLDGTTKVDTSAVLGVEIEHAHEGEGEGEHAGEEEGWNFHLVPKAVGEVKIVLLIMHGDHADFESQPVTVRVNRVNL